MIKVSYYNCGEETFKDPIKGKPFSHNLDRLEITQNYEEADLIFGYLDYLNCNQDYNEIVKSKVFKTYASKFVFYAMHDNPAFAYKDKVSTKIICQPLTYDIESFNIIPSPLQMRHFELEMIHDQEYIKKCRNVTKKYDLFFKGQVRYQNRHKIVEQDYGNLTTYFETTQPIWGIKGKERVNLIKDFNLEMAHSKFSFCPRGSGSSSFRFFHSLMVGSVPIISGHTRLPFEDEIDYQSICIMLDHTTKNYVDKLKSKINSINYDQMRLKGIEVWEKYFETENTDKYLFNKLINKCIHL